MGSRLNRILRGKHVDVWEAFAAELHAPWQEPEPGHPVRMEIAHAHGPIVLQGDVTMVMVGKVLIPVLSTVFTTNFPSEPDRRFSISRAGFSASVAEWFGQLDIQVDDATFDKAFVCKGETPDFVRAIFADAALRSRYLADFQGNLARRDDKALFVDPTPGIDPLELSVPGLIDDIAVLRALYALFAATVDRVALVASAPGGSAGSPRTL
jgi:hypothetical protein